MRGRVTNNRRQYRWRGLFVIYAVACLVQMGLVMWAPRASMAGNDGGRFEDLLFWNAVRAGKMSEIARLVEGGESLNRLDRNGMTPLLYAVQLKNFEMLSYILGNEVNMEQTGPSGDTPLIHAVRHGMVGMVDRLLQAGADINKQDRYGATPLMKAVEHGHAALVKKLLQEGASMDIMDYTGRDVMYYAENQRDGRMHRLLKEHR